MSDDRDPIQHDTETAHVKLYTLNAMVNFRLSKEREDIRQVLNEKRMQGIDISDYLSRIIREAEGLPQPGGGRSGVPASQPREIPSLQLSAAQMDELVARITQQLAKANVNVNSNDTAAAIVADTTSVEDKARKEELRNLAAGLTDWE